MSRPRRTWNGLPWGGANSSTCDPCWKYAAPPNGIARSTRYTLTGATWVADAIWRRPMGRKPMPFATWGEIQVFEAPVSMRVGKRGTCGGAPGPRVAVPAGSTPIFRIGPSAAL